ncbi:hypothetical protein TRIP_C20408 [Candidatus Zixiibacteriota bacterium]|nr:hypothetical protein TRIP_C20408 [candidate division Zixibacteria bacterium]
MKNRSLQIIIFLFFSGIALTLACSLAPGNVKSKLAEWRKGVWISGEGTYTIYTDNHYFVISFEGDTLRPNIYCGASQIAFTDKGTARKQVIRLRQNPGSTMNLFRELARQSDSTETPLAYDSTLFKPGACNIKDGVIYDAVTEVAADYILLSTCNGDKEKIYSNGVSVYLPAGGGEFNSYRIEKF